VFTMRNTTDRAATYDVAFPFEDPGHAASAKPDFKVRLSTPSGSRTEEVEVALRTRTTAAPATADTRHDFPAALVWPVKWERYETRIIRLSYLMGDATWHNGIVEGFRLSYIVRTGALWKGPIGRADFTIKLTGNSMMEAFFLEKSGKEVTRL